MAEVLQIILTGPVRRKSVASQGAGLCTIAEHVSGDLSEGKQLVWLMRWLMGMTVIAVLAGCARLDQIQANIKHEAGALQPGDLARDGLVFITPAAPTGQEADRQSVAFLFAGVIKTERPDISVTTLAQTLSAINREGLGAAYRRMYQDYQDTGVLPGETLALIGAATGGRYIAIIELSNFYQSTRGRFSLVGIRFLETKIANLRMFLQIWDSRDGSVVWEASEEINIAKDTAVEKPVTFEWVTEETARRLVYLFPGSPPPPTED